MTLSDAGPLSGCEVLIVEDRYLIASEMAEDLERWGATVLGPAASMAAAEQILHGRKPALALLDVKLEEEMVFPLAEQLARDGVRILFLTGYNEDVLPPPWRDYPRLLKPVEPSVLRDTLLRLARPDGGASAP